MYRNDDDFPHFKFSDFESHEFNPPRFDDDFFEEHDRIVESVKHGFSVMGVVVVVVGVLVALVVLALLCRCCARRNRGRVLSPPPPPGTVTAPYPQQQYATVVTAYPVAAYPAPAPPAGMQVVTTAAYPTAYPATGTAYPAAAAYPAAYAPAAAYPAPYPQPMPQPQPQTARAAPSAPDANALPPSYDQATGSDYNKHSTPFNPSYGHV